MTIERPMFLLWRAALVQQMLTPAPDVAAVLWKRAKLRAEGWRHTDVKPERLQRAIDADVDGLRLTRREPKRATASRCQKAEAVNNQRRGLKSPLTFCFRPEHELKPNPSRSRAALPARPDILHGARGKYDPAKGIRQEHRRGNQSKPRSPGTFWPPEPFWDWVAIHTPGWCVAGDWLPAPYCRAQPGGASVPLRQIRTLTTDTTTKGAGLATVPRFNVGKTNRLSIFPWGNLSATLPPPKIPRLLLPGACQCPSRYRSSRSKG